MGRLLDAVAARLAVRWQSKQEERTLEALGRLRQSFCGESDPARVWAWGHGHSAGPLGSSPGMVGAV